MILDSLAQAAQYHALSPHFAPAFAFFRQMTADTAPGRYEIAGDDVFALVQHYQTKPTGVGQYEVHRQYLDIQYIQRGREIIHWAPLAALTDITMPFDPAQDAALYRHNPAGVPLRLEAGQFAIFYPADGHIPGCAWDDTPAEVRKVVVKVRIG